MTRDKLILFISSSIPQPTLRRYARAMEKVGGLLVLRGTVGDPHKLQPTVRFMEHILKKDDLCAPPDCDYLGTHVTIDPRLFTRNRIKQVPALIFVEDMDMTNYIDKKEGDGMPESTQFIVYGDASLKGLATELHRLSKNERLLKVIKRM
nr:type-F conjugative transfer system pilin assembly protein TrbC [Pseudoalteromonas luteoviolacea]